MDKDRQSDDVAGYEEGKGPVRTCVVSRTEHPKENLIRFVADPSGQIVADLAGRLPGRGVWVEAGEAQVSQAIRSKAFARALKREVKVAPDLVVRIAELLEQRALSALSIANKAGLVTAGFAQVDALLDKGQVFVLLQASDAAAGGADKLSRKHRAIATAAGREPFLESLFTIQQMSLAMGRSNVVHAALIQGGATDTFLREAGRLRRYRPAPAGLVA